MLIASFEDNTFEYDVLRDQIRSPDLSNLISVSHPCLMIWTILRDEVQRFVIDGLCKPGSPWIYRLSRLACLPW